MAIKSLYNEKLGEKVARAASQKSYITYHIIPWGMSLWKVVPNRTLRSLRNFSTKGKALVFAKSTAKKKGGEIIVHTPDGRVENRISFTTAN